MLKVFGCCQGKQRVLRRDNVVRVELAELTTELDLDILSRLTSLSRAFSYCPSQSPCRGQTQVFTVSIKDLSVIFKLNGD